MALFVARYFVLHNHNEFALFNILASLVLENFKTKLILNFAFRVTDVNDNSPVFIGAPYVLNISELAVTGSQVFSDILAVDVDQPGPFSSVQYHIEPSPFSDMLVFDNQLQAGIL